MISPAVFRKYSIFFRMFLFMYDNTPRTALETFKNSAASLGHLSMGDF